jgi:phospholipid/cholesterol/gamma-HCH transport system substrate-binding protein
MWLGTIALGLVASVVGALLIISALDIGKTTYQAEFAQAASLGTGDQVTVAGISIGTVDGLKLAGDRVIVTFKIRDDVQLGRDTHAAIKLTTLLGSRYVELSPAGQGELSNETIPLSNTAVPYNLQQTLADATTTFGQIDADRIAQSLTTLTQSFQGVPEALPEALRNLRSLSGVLADRRDQLRSLLTSTDTVAKTIRDQKANLGSLVLQGRDLLGELTSRREAIRRLFAGATELVDTLKRVLDENPGLNELVGTMRELSKMLANNDALLRNILQVLPIPVRNLTNATGSGPAADITAPAGPMIDSWMCAISGRAKQFNLVEYFQDCQ